MYKMCGYADMIAIVENDNENHIDYFNYTFFFLHIINMNSFFYVGTHVIEITITC